ncbi:hypothetical protein MMC16_003884 [Acarospora aff. strigata]|nr:hypothetical protein [Acarospora aff. strigata]
MRAIFGSSLSVDERPGTPYQDVNLNEAVAEPKSRREGSIGRLHEVTSRIKKRLSRESAASKRSSVTKLRTEPSEDDFKRRNELRRAMHRRLQDELLADKSVSEGGYDTDAAYIETPKFSKGENTPSVLVSPEYLGRALRQLQPSPGIPGNPEAHNLSLHSSNNTNPGQVPEKLLHLVSEEAYPSTQQIPPALATAATPFNSNTMHAVDAVKPEGQVFAGLCAPSNPFSYSIIRARDSASSIPQKSSFSAGETIQLTAEPPSPDLLPARLPSVSAPTEQDGWRLSYASRKNQPTFPITVGREIGNVIIVENQPADGQLPGAVRCSLTLGMHAEAEEVQSPANAICHHVGDSSSGQASWMCDPPSQEGHSGSPSNGRVTTTEKSAIDVSRELEAASDQDADNRSVHLYNMRISKVLGSSSLLSASSLPQLGITRSHQGSNSSASALSLYLATAADHRRTSSSGDPGDKVSRSRGQLHKDTTSSIYGSNNASLASSPRGSHIFTPLLPSTIDKIASRDPSSSEEQSASTDPSDTGVVTSTSTWTTNEKDRLRRHTMDTTSFSSSTDSFRNKELAAAELRFATARDCTATPKASRFRENFDQASCQNASTCLHRHSIASLDGVGEWNVSGKRRVWSNELFPDSFGQDASIVWERALKFHADEQAAKSGTRPEGWSKEMTSETVYWRKKRESSTKDEQSPQKLFGSKTDPLTEGIAGALQGIRPRLSLDSAVSPGAEEVFKRKSLESRPAPPTGLWGQFSSHDRPERSFSPAGELDHVIVRDFAQEVKRDEAGIQKRKFSLVGGKKTRSMSNIFKSWSKVYKQHTTDFRRPPGGHRSSIAPGGILEFPELEIIGPPSPPYLSLEDLSITVAEVPELENTDVVRGSETKLAEATPVLQPGIDAKVWSEHYEDCVEYPPDTDHMSNADAADGNAQLRPEVIYGSSRLPRDLSGSSTQNMRRSTLAFHAQLQVDEVKAKEQVLRALE